MIKTRLAVIAALAFSANVFAAEGVSVPNTFTANTPASAAQVNANFTALVNAINSMSSSLSSLGTRVTTLEGSSPGAGTPTLSSLAGHYDLFMVGSGVGSSNSKQMSASASAVKAHLVLAAAGTFTYSPSGKETRVNTNLSTLACSGSNPVNNCTGNAGGVSVETEIQNEGGSGTWSVANGILTLTPGDGGAVVVTLTDPGRLDGGRVGFALETESEGGDRYQIDVLVRVPAPPT